MKKLILRGLSLAALYLGLQHSGFEAVVSAGNDCDPDCAQIATGYYCCGSCDKFPGGRTCSACCSAS